MNTLQEAFSFTDWINSLNKISEMILMDEKLDVTTGTILEIMNTHLQAYAAIYLTLDIGGENLVLHSFTQNKMVDKVLNAIPFEVNKIQYPLKIKGAAITQCVIKNKIIQKPNLKDFFYPVFKPAFLLDKVQKIIGLNMCAAAPVRIKGKPIGAFFVVTKKKNFTEDDLHLLQFYANMSGITLENHLRLERLGKKYEMEKETTALLGHELKTPIAITHNNTQVLDILINKHEKLHGVDLPELRNIQLKLEGSIQHLTQLCDSILSLREIENNVPYVQQKLDLEHFLSQIMKNFEQKAKDKNLTFQCKYRIKPGTFYGGGVQFEQVVTILVDNAVKYTQKGGVDVKISMDGKHMTCYVTDTGVGIPKTERHRVFDRFYKFQHESLKHVNIRGLGLGLYIAFSIVKALHGKITIKDNPTTRGTQFMVKIPIFTGN